MDEVKVHGEPEVELQEMPSSSTDRRFSTPDRKPAEKRRGPLDDGEDPKFRCTVDSPVGSMPYESDERIYINNVAMKKMKETLSSNGEKVAFSVVKQDFRADRAFLRYSP